MADALLPKLGRELSGDSASRGYLAQVSHDATVWWTRPAEPELTQANRPLSRPVLLQQELSGT